MTITPQQVGLIKWANHYDLASQIYGSGQTSHRIAMLTGISHSTMMKIVRGKTIPTLEQAKAIQELVTGWEPIRTLNPDQSQIRGSK